MVLVDDDGLVMEVIEGRKRDMTYVAERELFAVNKQGDSFLLKACIGVPYSIATDEWRCAVRLEGLFDEVRDMRGVDSWQALNLAIRLAVQLLEDFISSGGALYCGKDGTPISPRSLHACG